MVYLRAAAMAKIPRMRNARLVRSNPSKAVKSKASPAAKAKTEVTTTARFMEAIEIAPL
jgi:hypothetical protein